MKKFSSAAFGMGLAVMAAAPASASTVELLYGGIAKGVDITASLGGDPLEPSGPFPAGSLLMTENPPSAEQSFLAWCVELEIVIASGPIEYHTSMNLLPPTQEKLISELFTRFLDDTASDEGAAAFQLAIWEILEETDDPPLDVTAGRFAADVVDSANDGVLTTANSWLGALDGSMANFRINYFQSENSQDLITATPIPLPASVLLLGAGLGALTAVRRRSRSKSAEA